VTDGVDHHHSEWFGPCHRVDQAGCVGKQRQFGVTSYLADILDVATD
jgi:hypothetical protein